MLQQGSSLMSKKRKADAGASSSQSKSKIQTTMSGSKHGLGSDKVLNDLKELEKDRGEVSE